MTEVTQEKRKNTPSNCQLDRCSYNAIPPGENSQECISCERLNDSAWLPLMAITHERAIVVLSASLHRGITTFNQEWKDALTLALVALIADSANMER